jgi:hypothetical protein
MNRIVSIKFMASQQGEPLQWQDRPANSFQHYVQSGSGGKGCLTSPAEASHL